MFRSSPSVKESKSKGIVHDQDPTDPVVLWTMEQNFTFPPPRTVTDELYSINRNSRFKIIHHVPKVGHPLYHLLSQYNPWLDCEMTREKRAFLKPRAGELSCAVYDCNSAKIGHDVYFFRNDTVMDIVNLYLWPLLYSHADEVIACRSFVEWCHLFTRTIIFAFPDYAHWNSIATLPATTIVPVSEQYRISQFMKYITPGRVLYLLTTRANFWPYGSSSQQYGICTIKSKIKEYTDKTKIEWVVSADFLRKMKRVHIYFASLPTTDPSVSINDSDSEIE
jgi:hypothetical protein